MRRAVRGNGPVATPAPRPGPTQRGDPLHAGAVDGGREPSGVGGALQVVLAVAENEVTQVFTAALRRQLVQHELGDGEPVILMALVNSSEKSALICTALSRTLMRRRRNSISRTRSATASPHRRPV